MCLSRRFEFEQKINPSGLKLAFSYTISSHLEKYKRRSCLRPISLITVRILNVDTVTF